MQTEQTRASAEAFWQFMASRDLDKAADHIAADYHYVGPGGVEARGVDGFTGMLASYFSAFPDLAFNVHEMVCEQDRAVSRFTASGTHVGELMGIAATGRKVSFAGTVIARFVHGKVVQEWESLDELALMQQLGVLPAD